jgi:hypothetical protein
MAMVGMERGSVAEWAGDMAAGMANGQTVDLSATCHLGNALAGCMDVVHAGGCSTHIFGEHQAMATHLPFLR